MKGGENGFASYTRALVHHIHKYSVQDGAWPLVAATREALSTRTGGYGSAITNCPYWSKDNYQNFLTMVERMKDAAGNQIDSDKRASKASQLGIVQNATASGQLQQPAPSSIGGLQQHAPPPPPPRPQQQQQQQQQKQQGQAQPSFAAVAATPTMTDLFTMMQGFQTTMQAVSARVEGQAQQLASLQAGAGDGISVNSALTDGTGSLMDGYGNISRT